MKLILCLVERVCKQGEERGGRQEGRKGRGEERGSRGEKEGVGGR